MGKQKALLRGFQEKMSDIFSDLLEGVPPWEYNDNVEMSDVVFELPNLTPPKEEIAFPPHWGELMEQIRVREEEMKRVMLSRRSGGRDAVSPAPVGGIKKEGDSASTTPRNIPPSPMMTFKAGDEGVDMVDNMLPPSSYEMLPPQNSTSPSFEPPNIPYPQLPFWTAAPLPFSPSVYPVNVLPPNARESLLAPKAPPFTGTVQKNVFQGVEKKKKKPGRKPKMPGRARDEKGLFIKSPPGEANHQNNVNKAKANVNNSEDANLIGKIQELQNQLLESRYESVMLRQELLTSQMELSQLKERGLVKSNIPQYSQSVSTQMASPQNGHSQQVSPNSKMPPSMVSNQSSPMQDAFRVSLDYNQLKSKLKPTNGGHYDVAQDHVQHDEQPFVFEMEEV